MNPYGFASLKQTLPYWPADVFGQPEFLDEIGVRDFEIQHSDPQLALTGTLIWVREISFDLPLIKGFSVALLSANGYTAVPFEVDILPDFVLRIPDISIAFRMDTKLLRPVKRVNQKWVPITVGGNPKPAELTFTGIGVQADLSGNLELLMPANAPLGSLGAVQIGDTGIVLELEGLSPYFSVKQVPPAGAPPGFRGVKINSLKVHLPDDFDVPAVPDTLIANDVLLGTGGLSGTIGARWSASFLNGAYTGSGAGTLFGIPFGLKSLDVTFKQNIPTAFAVQGEILLPFFDHPVKVSIGIDSTGGFAVSLDSGTSNGLFKLTKPGILAMELDSIGFELKDGLFVAKLSGQLTPLFGTSQGLNWPGFKVEELSIDSKGHVHLQGGWLVLRQQYNLDFHGFHVGITKLGFGKTEDGGKWVGFSGELKLVDGFTAGASVEGLRVTWYDDGRQTKISFNGIGVEFEIPDVLYFKGDVAYRELQVGNESVKRFDGDIKLSLISLKLEIDAKLVVGSASGPQGSYNFFAIYLGVELPTGIPLSPTPLALFGMAGLFALSMEPDKREDEEWYEGWFKRPEIGITDLESKWVNRRGSMAFGVGATIGTSSDNGFTFACKALLVIVFPGPIVLLEGKANLLKERAKLSDDPMFRSLAVLDTRQGQILMGLDAKYKQDESGKVIDITAGAEAFFHNPGDWHVYMGEREPREKRIRARILSLFEANSYFMIDPHKLATGAWVGYARSWKFGPVSLTLEAWLEGNVVVNWTPLHFHGDLWLHGNIDVNVFGFGLGLSVDARFEADVFDPFHVKASFEVSFKLPKPLGKKKKNFELTLEWGPIPDWPKLLPLPLKEVAIEHFKVTTSWPLPKNGAQPLLLPKYDTVKEGLRNENAPPSFNDPPLSALPVVPLDSRPHISFGRAVHDDALVGINPQPVYPAKERIGDPEKDEGPVQVRYALKQIELAKRDAQTQQWQTIAAAGRPLNSGERKLYGSWAPVPQLPSGAGQAAAAANVKLWLWSKTPFDYTRHGGSEVDDWFIANFPNYPCVPQEIPDREVCCDFEKLARSQFLETPWRSPEHPEITLTWASRVRRRVNVLDPPVNGFTRALCFRVDVATRTTASQQITGSKQSVLQGQKLSGILVSEQQRLVANAAEQSRGATQPLTNSVTINLSAPAKRVKVWVVEGKKPDKVCLNFRNRQRSDVKLPLNEQGVTIGAGGVTKITAVPTTLGDMMGLTSPFAVPGTPQVGLNITLPCAATIVELMLSYISPVATDPTLTIAAFNSRGEQIAAKPILNPQRQPEIVRFEGKDIKQVRISAHRSQVFLHELCFLCPDTSPGVTATGFDIEGRLTKTFANQGNVVEVSGENLTRVEVSGKAELCLLKICALFGPDTKDLAHLQEMENHLKNEVARWQQEGEVLEPFSAYRLKIVTAIDADGMGELSGSKNLTQVEYAYFRTEGPPGLAKLSLPAGRDATEADKFDSGLDDLTRYVRQTTPATVPAIGEKPVMAKPFYRAYDVGVDFNEDYVDLMYRMSGRDLGLYIYDNNNQPARDAEGRLLAQSGDWGSVEELTLTEGEQHWLAISNTANRCLPLIQQDSIVHDKKLTSAIAGRVLKADTLHEARLIPLLLREGFRRYATGATAQGPSGKLERWQVIDAGSINAPSNWAVGETVAPVSKYLTQTSSIRGGNSAAGDPVKPGTMLLLGNDPSLNAAHQEQPANWTDYRLSVYLHAAGSGAIGVVFRYQDGNNYYRLSLNRNGPYRRLVSVANGIHTILKEDDFAYDPQRDYLITVEAINSSLRVYQDGALVFEVTDATHPKGSIGLYCYDNPGARFNDVRVDDFRETAQAVYRFQFTTSLFANFFHHLHSYQDETWRVAVEGVASVAYPAIAKAVKPSVPRTEDETRAYETLATAVLGQAARQNPAEVQVTRVEIDNMRLAFLVQSPEPIDWHRTELSLLRTDFTRTEPALPGKVKLTAANFGANKPTVDSVVLLLREPLNLTGYKVDSRLVTWPLNRGRGLVFNAQTLPGAGFTEPAWETYHTFGAEKTLPAGTMLQVLPSNAIAVPAVGLAFFSIELRIVAPDGMVIHARHFLPDDNYVSEDVNVLRKADGTGFFMVKLDSNLSGIPFSLGQYRLKFTYRRNNRAHVPTSQILSQAGNQTDEVVTIDIPLQTQ